MRLGRQTLRDEVDLRDRTLVGLLVLAVAVLAMFGWQAERFPPVARAWTYPEWLGLVAAVVLVQLLVLAVLGGLLRTDGGLAEYLYTGLLLLRAGGAGAASRGGRGGLPGRVALECTAGGRGAPGAAAHLPLGAGGLGRGGCVGTPLRHIITLPLRRRNSACSAVDQCVAVAVPRPSSLSRSALKIKTILVSQPAPTDEKSPYHELAKKFALKIEFRPFIKVEAVPGQDFRQERINILDHTAIVLTSRNAVDHFFRMCKELRLTVPETMKYFCVSESVAYYVQKYIVYRKRKVFIGKQTFADLMDVIKKHKDEKYLVPCSDIQKRARSPPCWTRRV